LVTKSNPNFNPRIMSRRRAKEKMSEEQEESFRRMKMEMAKEDYKPLEPMRHVDPSMIRKLPKRLKPHTYRKTNEASYE